MLESFPVVFLVSTCLGILTGLGVGGGSLLILWLTLVLNWEPGIARSVNLLFFLPGAALSCLLRKKEGQLPVKKLLPAILTGCTCGALFAWASASWDTALLRKLFGFLLLFTGVRELTYQKR